MIVCFDDIVYFSKDGFMFSKRKLFLAGRGPMDWGRGNEKLVPGEREFEWEGQGVWEPVTVYDPDDSIGRFHPRYELLIEACAYYLEVREGRR